MVRLVAGWRERNGVHSSMRREPYNIMWSRRDFVRLAAGSAVGAGFLPVVTGRGDAAMARAGSPALPPRTIGLRTEGGRFYFDPPGLHVARGASVVWLNIGDFHTVSAFHPDNAKLLPGDVPLRIPEGAVSFHSGFLGLSGGTQFEYTFEVEGVYDYFCQPHYISFGMVGRVIAGSPQGGPAVTRPLDELEEAAQKMMPPVERIMGPTGRAFEWTSRINGLLLLRANHTPVTDAADALRQDLGDDTALSGVLTDAGVEATFHSALGRLLEAVRNKIGYEAVVRQADAAKELLAKASEA